MQVTRMYSGDDGRSHFEEVELETEAWDVIGFSSKGWSTAANDDVWFVSLDDREMPLHNPSRRQFIIVLAGTFEVGCADGVAAAGPGTVLFAEDMTGEGHTTRLTGGVRLMSFGVADDFALGSA